jgi:hypothetical protein
MVTRTNTIAVDTYVDGESDVDGGSERDAGASVGTYVGGGRNTHLTVPLEPSGEASREHARDLEGTNAWLAECGSLRAVSLADERSTPSAGTVRRYDGRERRP